MARLERICEGPDGWRHYLDGEPVHAGDALELLTADGWRLVRYERFGGSGPDFQAVGYLDQDRGLALRADSELRWPAR